MTGPLPIDAVPESGPLVQVPAIGRPGPSCRLAAKLTHMYVSGACFVCVFAEHISRLGVPKQVIV
jgi:hypothetical protein